MLEGYINSLPDHLKQTSEVQAIVNKMTLDDRTITNNEHRTIDFGKTSVKRNVDNPNQVYVKNIPFTVSGSALEVIFEDFGSVTKAQVISQKVKDVKGK